MVTATMNIPAMPLVPDEVLIQDYSENAGILAVLVPAGIVARPERVILIGFVTVTVCRLLSDLQVEPGTHVASGQA